MKSTNSARAFCGSCDTDTDQSCDEHRQLLGLQLDEITVEHDALRHTIIESANQTNSLMTFINQWEEKSHEKVRKTAEEIREEVNKLEHHRRSQFFGKLDEMKEQIARAQREDMAIKNDLSTWKFMLEKLKEEFQTSSLSNEIIEDETSPLIHRIQISSTSTKLPLNPINTIHPRLRYTHQYGVYVNPRTFLVTPIWYFYSPKHHNWFWTPYGKFHTWMPVNTVIVTDGFYKNQVPAPVNVEIIEYLRKHNPIPPKLVLQVAEKSEHHILNF